MREPIPIPDEQQTRRVSVLDFLHLVNWLDGSPILDKIEEYRLKILSDVLDQWDGDRIKYTLALAGRAKKNAKSLDLVLAGLFALVANDSVHGNDVLIVATDEGQAQDDLSLTKKLVLASPHLMSRLVIYEKRITRKDHKGGIAVLPGRDVLGSHGRTYRFLGFDELHTQRDWAMLEALALDPTRRDAQMWITSYASIFHKPGVPLFDLLQRGKANDDPRMYFSWYASDWSTDPEAMALESGEARANPSRASFDPDYLDTQRRRLPSHIYRRLHLNLPGSPEGSAYQAEVILDSITRGVRIRKYEPSILYHAFVDMSGGSNDDAVLAIAYQDHEGRAVLAHVLNQGTRPPFDPRAAVERFARTCKEYGIRSVVGDSYAGEVFLYDFARHGIDYEVSALPASKMYEAVEPHLNAREIVLLDHADVESQFLGLVWRGAKIDHLPGEHDDYANAVTGALLLALHDQPVNWEITDDERMALYNLTHHPGEFTVPADEIGPNFFDDW